MRDHWERVCPVVKVKMDFVLYVLCTLYKQKLILTTFVLFCFKLQPPVCFK